MAFDFPSFPTKGDVYSSAGVTYVWNGYAWIAGVRATILGAANAKMNRTERDDASA